MKIVEVLLKTERKFSNKDAEKLRGFMGSFILTLIFQVTFLWEKEKVLVLPKEEIDTQLITKVNNVLKEIFGASCEISIDSPKERFKNARKKIKSIDENLGYLKTLKDLDAYEKLMEIISDKKPYTRIKDIDGLINSIEIEEQNIIENEKNILIAKGEESKERLANILKDETEILNRIDKEFDKFNERVKNYSKCNVRIKRA